MPGGRGGAWWCLVVPGGRIKNFYEIACARCKNILYLHHLDELTEENKMRFTIKSRKLKMNFDFFLAKDGGYVRLESPGKSGTLGIQICDGGSFMGSTITSTEKAFPTVCRKWYRQYIKKTYGIF